MDCAEYLISPSPETQHQDIQDAYTYRVHRPQQPVLPHQQPKQSLRVPGLIRRVVVPPTLTDIRRLPGMARPSKAVGFALLASSRISGSKARFRFTRRVRYFCWASGCCVLSFGGCLWWHSVCAALVGKQLEVVMEVSGHVGKDCCVRIHRQCRETGVVVFDHPKDHRD